MNMVTINDKPVNGPAGCLIGGAILLFLAVVFGVIALIFATPVWLPVLLGIFIGKHI